MRKFLIKIVLVVCLFIDDMIVLISNGLNIADKAG